MSIVISPLTKDDFQTLIEWAEDEKILLQWAGPYLKYPLTNAQLAEYLAPARHKNPVRYVFRALDEADMMVGMAELNVVDRANETATLCRIFVDKNRRGRGLADSIIKQVISYGFDILKLNRIDLKVFTYNSAAIKCYERLGFVREGLMRKVCKFNNEYWDCYVYSMLRNEWEARRT
jgi:RimJ/RimL family protein N-acetyltransferase